MNILAKCHAPFLKVFEHLGIREHSKMFCSTTVKYFDEQSLCCYFAIFCLDARLANKPPRLLHIAQINNNGRKNIGDRETLDMVD